MHKYLRVTLADRCHIQAFLQAGLSQKEISLRIGKHKSTISREIGRNKCFKGYFGTKAQEKRNERFKSCRRKPKIDDVFWLRILELLREELSPEQISGRLLMEGQPTVSHTTIYHFLWKRKNQTFRYFLRRFNKKGAGRYRQRRRLADIDKLNIRQRPLEANLRRRLGDWERDTLYAANHKQVLVCVDRKTRFTKIAKVTDGQSKSISKLTLKLIGSTGKPIHTITNDNGPEMRDGHKMKVPVYHCDPRRPEQRGTVENTIGLLRSYIKRKTDLSKITDKALKAIETKLNMRPRKCLDYLTPYEVFYDKKVALAS